ncbi:MULTISPECIES: hypothetical protein [unclassified Polaromonas]|uniref:hypothetical protein n=1 Tax=unclassified Polaromonas TaxID=2638319 RepID=UPI000BC94F8D|nr:MULTISPECIES: hypothetical protein [unclassified Polaromonas]OYY34595.1 MAG: hypothetical protein B7Y60_16080 [Polaromonas sp. 35-63-35]OYZ15084.1 MAG: hypothetical protein B7Y28_22720 [Polaromonas sp. 16-63-31]OZA49641.1 MAG: hypothetical protein B7X88_14620 [Polaromonas sp. 17-63-33]HQR97591.1 hypothetical protein [Polaromonas sp.]HQS40085.1 hypothetical protein [Polaromonas sp.]
MKVEFDLWQLILLASMIMGAFWGMAKMMLVQQVKFLDAKFKTTDDRFEAIDDKFEAMNKRLTVQDESDRRIERDIAALRVELPTDYVRREDFTRVIASFEIKVDNLRLTIERAMFGDKRV